MSSSSRRGGYLGVLFLGGLLGLGALSARAASLDDFNDNATGPQWRNLTDAAAQINLVEQNGRVEALVTNSTASTNDATYVSAGPSGFALSTSEDFELRVQYSFTTATYAGAFGDAAALFFGVGKNDVDDPNPGQNAAGIGFGVTRAGVQGVFETNVFGGLSTARVNDIDQDTELFFGAASTGTFVVSYVANTDTLSLGYLGGGSDTRVGMVQGQWLATDYVLVSFGIRGRGYNVASGNAFFDNLELVSGTVVPIPETSPSIFLALAALLVGVRRSTRARSRRL